MRYGRKWIKITVINLLHLIQSMQIERNSYEKNCEFINLGGKFANHFLISEVVAKMLC